MQISMLPVEMIIEIIKFLFTRINLLSKLSLVCKEWHTIIKSEDFCKFIYHSFFGWRNNDVPVSTIINNLNNNIKYQSLLQKELNYWYRWNFHSQRNEFKINKNNNLLKVLNNNLLKVINKNNNLNSEKPGQHLLRILKLKTNSKRNLITEPIFYNTGIYYFEVKCLQWHNNGSDNVLAGFIFQPLSTINNYNKINYEGYLGSDNGSFGLYFSTGGIYGVYNRTRGVHAEYLTYVNQKIDINTKVGVYLDTNNLLVRFVLVKEKKLFPMLSLNTFLNDEEIESFKEKQLVFYPAVSLLYVNGELELNSTAGFKSVKKAKWIKEVVSEQ